MMEFGVVAFGVFAVGLLASVIGVQLAIGGTAAALLLLSFVSYSAFPQLRRLQ